MFKKSILTVLVILAFVLVTLPVLAEDQNQVVATINGQNVTLGQLDEVINLDGFLMDIYQANAEFAQLLVSSENGQKLLNEYRKAQLEQYATHMALVQDAKNQGLKLTDDVVNSIFNDQIAQIMEQNNLTKDQLIQALQAQGIESLDKYKEYFVEKSGDSILVNELQDKVLNAVTATDQEIKDYYLSHPQEFIQGPEVHARHILVDNEVKANQLLAQIKAGADFAKLAKENSTDTGSAQNGGDLGFFSKGEMVAEFENAAFALKAGEVSGVVKSQFGYHIIKVEEVKAQKTLTFDEVKEQIKTELVGSKKESAWTNYVDNVRKNAKIEIKL